ncbi:MAG: hypothetical protein MK100_03880 [Phycisphaerales bacterium]|nr:hypothetical protein [Phycisphaerales bacterium]
MEMAEDIAASDPVAVPQEGEAVVFERRQPAESVVPDVSSIGELYDFIRMLDAEGYPHAFVIRGGLRIAFTDASREGDSIVASAKIEFVADD